MLFSNVVYARTYELDQVDSNSYQWPRWEPPHGIAGLRTKGMLTPRMISQPSSVWAWEYPRVLWRPLGGRLRQPNKATRWRNTIAAWYAEGWGVPQNFVEAHKWMNLAAAAGDPGAPVLRDLEAVLPSWPFGPAALRCAALRRPASLASLGASD